MIKRILLYNSGGGLGDSIQLIPLILGLQNYYKTAEFFYLGAHENHFGNQLKDYNIKIKTLNLDLKYFGFRWKHLLEVKSQIRKKNISKFDLIIDLQSKIRNSLILKMIPHSYFVSSCFNFLLSRPRIKIKKNTQINYTILEAVNKILDINCVLLDYNLNKINKKYFAEAKKLLPKNNYVGFSITQGNVYRKKEWPINNVISLCNKFKNKVPVFFIEKKNIDLKNRINKLIPNAIFPEHDSVLSSPALVTCLGKRLDFAVSIDNGVMHMLALCETPMIVLFGPTNSEKFAPDYKDLIVLDSKKINNTSDISTITAEDVLETAKQHLNF